MSKEPDEYGRDLPEAVRENLKMLSDDEYRELARTWQLAEYARGPDPTETDINEAERRLLEHVAEQQRRTPAFRIRIRHAASAAAVLLVFAAAWYLLAGRPDPLPTSSPEFMLLLHGEPLDRYPEDQHAAIISEYVSWARSLMQDGRLVAGNELARGGRVLRSAEGGVRHEPLVHTDLAVSGYFVITAADIDEASRIAADCPHLKYDGTVEVRQVGSN